MKKISTLKLKLFARYAVLDDCFIVEWKWLYGAFDKKWNEILPIEFSILVPLGEYLVAGKAMTDKIGVQSKYEIYDKTGNKVLKGRFDKIGKHYYQLITKNDGEYLIWAKDKNGMFQSSGPYSRVQKDGDLLLLD